MTKDWVLFHLQEAKEELDKTIGQVQSQSDYEVGQFAVAMQHLYHHLNTAWNSQNVDPERANRCSDEDFQSWRQFPSDINM